MRLDGWEARLDDVLEGYAQARFRWGDRDCLLLAFDVIKAISGVVLYPDERGRYADLNGAKSRLTANGFQAPIDVIAAHLTEIPVASAKPGDIGMIQTRKGDTLVIFLPDEVVGWTPSGMKRLPRESAARAFAVESSRAESNAQSPNPVEVGT